MPHRIPKIHSFINKELSEDYLNFFLREFGIDLVSIFVPIYLFVKGYSLPEVMLFLAFLFFFVLVGFLVAAKLMPKTGVKHLIAASVPFLVLYLALLNFLELSPLYLVLVAVIGGLQAGLYWFPFHYSFARNSLHKYRGKEVGLIKTGYLLATIFAPLLGAAIITFYGFPLLFGTAILLVVISIVPLFLSKELHTKPEHVSISKMFKATRIKGALIHFSFGINDVAGRLIWPLYIFFVLGEYLALGTVFFASGIIAIAITLITGKLTDSRTKNKLVKFGSVVNSLSWFFRGTARRFQEIFLFHVLGTFSFVFVEIPTTSFFYDQTNLGEKSEYIVFRELCLVIGRVFIFGLLGVLALAFSGLLPFFAVFIVTGILSLSFLLLTKLKWWNE